MIWDFILHNDSLLISGYYVHDSVEAADLFLLAPGATAWKGLGIHRESGVRAEGQNGPVEIIEHFGDDYVISNRSVEEGRQGSVQTCSLLANACREIRDFPYGVDRDIQRLGFSEGEYLAVSLSSGSYRTEAWIRKGIWEPDSVTNGFDAFFSDGRQSYVSKGNTIFLRTRDSLKELIRMPARVGVFAIQGNTVLALSDTGSCVVDLGTGQVKYFPDKVVEGPGDIRASIWVLGDYMVYGVNEELHVFNIAKGVLKTFRLSEYVTGNRWIATDSLLVSASLWSLVSLRKSDLDAQFR
jgi:hypothetical protein